MKRLATLFLFLSIVNVQSALAWTRAADERIAKKGADLAPPDLRLLLDRFHAEYTRGIERAQSEESAGAHDYFVLSRKGRLRERIQRETAAAITQIRKGDPMPSVAERLGVIAHLVADANDPFHVSNEDERLSLVRGDFERYFERTQPRFATVFYGLDPNFRMASFLDRTFARTAKFYPLIGSEYFAGDSRRTSAEFDDRSTAFGVAAVCHSHAVTDLVNLYYYIWKEAGGDVRAARVMRGGNLMLNQ